MSTTLNDLKKHATRHGVGDDADVFMETGKSLGFSFEELVKLQKHLDEIEERARSRFARPKRRRLTVEERVKRFLGISDEEEAA